MNNEMFKYGMMNSICRLILLLVLSFNNSAMAVVNVVVESVPMQPLSPSADKPFTKIEGFNVGLYYPTKFDVRDLWEPFYYGRGMAAGDVHKDGWPDIAIGSEDGVRLFRNSNGVFSEQKINIPGFRGLNTFVVSLVDVDNDGWLDIFLTSYKRGNYYVINDSGEFKAKNFHKVEGGRQTMTVGLSFGDIDKDGDLDVALGNWYYGWPKQIPAEPAQNFLMKWGGGGYSRTPLAGPTGETLTTLISDFNQDGNPDLFVGNDFVQPDVFYIGQDDGSLKMHTQADGVFATSADTTMSIDTVDLDNDLEFEVYVAQIAAGVDDEVAKIRRRSLEQYCVDIRQPQLRRQCEQIFTIRKFFKYDAAHQPADLMKCKQIPVDHHRKACMAMTVMKTAIQQKQPKLCDKIPQSYVRIRYQCKSFFVPSVMTSKEEYDQALPQKKNKNVLLVKGADGTYSDNAEPLHLGIGAWTWNSKFADVDNDGWQDLYIVNGYIRKNAIPSNLFYRNKGGKQFAEETDTFGLENYMAVSSYVYVDFDNDGDLDIVTNSAIGPMWVYRNNQQHGQSIAIKFEDEIGNSCGIGNKVIIKYGESERTHQVKELKSGGGFMSFDDPVLHFGLGGHKSVSAVDVIWSTGEKTKLSGPFPARRQYTIRRE